MSDETDIQVQKIQDLKCSIRNLQTLQNLKKTLQNLVGLWEVPLENKTKKNLLTGAGIKLSAECYGCDISLYYERTKSNWLGDYYTLSSILITLKGIEVISAANPHSQLNVNSIGSNVIPNELIKDRKYVPIQSVLAGWGV